MDMLFDMFMSGSELSTSKWLHYFPIYERFFSKFVNTDVRILEIGVQHGGSLRLWKRYFGPYARITGLDIDPASKNVEDLQTEVFIGNQSDEFLLEEIHTKRGPFDIIIDDGSHKSSDVLTTFEFFQQKMARNSIYVIEDTHTAMMQGYTDVHQNEFDIYSRLFSVSKDISSGYESRGIGEFTQTVFGISFFDSIIVVEYRDPVRRIAQGIIAESSPRIVKTQYPGKLG